LLYSQRQLSKLELLITITISISHQ